jgi:hypothetical protein
MSFGSDEASTLLGMQRWVEVQGVADEKTDGLFCGAEIEMVVNAEGVWTPSARKAYFFLPAGLAFLAAPFFLAP